MVVSINSKHAFVSSGKNIGLSILEVLLCAAVGDLALSKNMCDWGFLNTVLLPPFLAKAVVLDGQASAAELLDIFGIKILERRSESTTNE